MELVKNQVAFSAFLDTRIFLQQKDTEEPTLEAIRNIFGLTPEEVWAAVREKSAEEFATLVVLSDDLSQSQLVKLRSLSLPALVISSDFKREYVDGPVFSSVLGYIGRVSPDDLAGNGNLSAGDFVGKAGVEAYYDSELRGVPGVVVKLRDAHGNILDEVLKNKPQIGKELRLTIDGEFQKYFYGRMLAGLQALGRQSGVGLAVNPETGEVLALVNFPSYDNNVFSLSHKSDERAGILNSDLKPLFNRAVSGMYNPGSTIKPLVGVAALSENVIDPSREIFSPGYLDVPNPYDPEHPTRYLDWRYQGNVDLVSAISQSSNVYFYTVGGGAATQILKNGVVIDTDRIDGLGINRLNEWWQKFGLGKKLGVDLPNEASGFLPTAEWKKKKTGRPWMLGDTYNVSIGQGDLLVTPIQLLNCISSIANGGKIYKPTLNLDKPHTEFLGDITYLEPEIKEIQKGMIEAVTSPMGTAYRLNDLGFSVAAKTGSAQIKNNEQVNALFIGYAPTDKPQIAVLVLVENALEGSLNAVPIAKDVLNWYYWNRVKK